MIVNLASAKGPTVADLKMLERLGQRGRAFEVTPADEEEAYVLARARATLDDMAECLCEEGPRAPDLARGWQVLDRLQARLRQLQAMPATTGAGLELALQSKPGKPQPSAGCRRRPQPPRAPSALRPKEIHPC